ncbi:MAG: hypothetical protein QXP70_04920 [Methanomassiliicoccales archaeon]
MSVRKASRLLLLLEILFSLMLLSVMAAAYADLVLSATSISGASLYEETLNTTVGLILTVHIHNPGPFDLQLSELLVLLQNHNGSLLFDAQAPPIALQPGYDGLLSITFHIPYTVAENTSRAALNFTAKTVYGLMNISGSIQNIGLSPASLLMRCVT